MTFRREGFLKQGSKSTNYRVKILKFYNIKVKSLLFIKRPPKERKRQTTNLQKILATHITSKDL